MCVVCEHPSRTPNGEILGLNHTTDSVIDCLDQHFGIVYKSDLDGFWFENKEGVKISIYFDSRFNHLGTMMYGMEMLAHMVLNKGT